MKTLFYFAALLLTMSAANAQKIKLKKEIVYVDDVRTFKFDKKAMGNDLHVYKLNSKEELLNIAVISNGTESKVDDSKTITFTEQNATIKSKDFRAMSYEVLLGLLLELKVINLNGEVSTDNLMRFKAKYDDSNINHTDKH